MSSTENEQQPSPEMEREVAQRARIRAGAARWDVSVAIFLFAILIIIVVLQVQGIGVEIVALIASFGLVIAWFVGWRRGKQLYQSFYKEIALREELEAEIDKRIELTRTLVHELKTPLTPMIAASELLIDEAPEGPLVQLARSINKGAEVLAKRIDALLDVAKGELGILELSRTETDFLNLLQKVAEDTTPLAYSRKQVFNVKLPKSLPMISADGERLRQVIVNLLDNSFKYTPAGGTITLRAGKKDDAIIIEVEDTGPGISADQQQHIFKESYYAKSENQHGKGLGLGLVLSRMLVELHGGKIWVESQEGKGSKFKFSVPLPSGPQKKVKP